MNIRKATLQDYNDIFNVVHTTIKEIYPNFYPIEVVDFFLNYHCESKIKSDIGDGYVYVLSVEDHIIGTGSIEGQSIGRLYITPEQQNKGYGTAVLSVLENEVAIHYPTSQLEASLPSYDFYLNHGYQPKEYNKYNVNNGRVLCYYTMEKHLNM